jgi:hypothetical protein
MCLRKTKMIINIWNEEEDIENFTPSQKVFTLRLHTAACPTGFLCDKAWTAEDEVKTHFWYLFLGGSPEKGVTVTMHHMSFEAYINKHLEEVVCTEPTLVKGRLLFVERWKKFWTVL